MKEGAPESDLLNIAFPNPTIPSGPPTQVLELHEADKNK